MLYRKQQWIYLVAFLLAVGAHFTPVSYDRSTRMIARTLVRRPRKINPLELNRELIKHFDFSKMFKELHEYLSPEEVRIVTTLGLVTGILRAEESMREHLYVLTDDLLGKYSTRNPKENMEKMVAVEKIINRDKSIVKVLNEMLKYARNATTMDALQMEMLDILKEVRMMTYNFMCISVNAMCFFCHRVKTHRSCCKAKHQTWMKNLVRI